jgi:ribosomal protein S18 acetylase RimI-like enzyme
MRITHATVEDSLQIAEVHVRSWQKAYASQFPSEFLNALSVADRAAMWSTLLCEGSPIVLVARQEGQVCGFLAFSASRDEDALPNGAEIQAIYLLPAVWSRGIGHALWNRARKKMADAGYKTVKLWVITDNERAIRFYRSVGFVEEIAALKTFVLGGQRLTEVRYARSTDA